MKQRSRSSLRLKNFQRGWTDTQDSSTRNDVGDKWTVWRTGYHGRVGIFREDFLEEVMFGLGLEGKAGFERKERNMTAEKWQRAAQKKSEARRARAKS